MESMQNIPVRPNYLDKSKVFDQHPNSHMLGKLDFYDITGPVFVDSSIRKE